MAQELLDSETEVKLEHLGTFKWNELANLRPSPTGIKLQGLVEDMWSKKGHKIHKQEFKHAREYNILFDMEYVLDFIHNKIFIPLGINNNGDFNRELLDEIIEKAILYSLDEEKRQAEKEMVRMSQPFIEENGLTPDQALELVKRQRQVAEEFLKTLAAK